MIDLTQLQIPPADVVSEPTADDWKWFWTIDLPNWDNGSGDFTIRILRCAASLARRCRELEAEVERLRTPKMIRRSATGTTGESI